MKESSFSDKLSWHIICIVMVFSVIAQMVTAFVITDGSMNPLEWWHDSTELMISLTVIGVVSFVLIYIATRGAIKRMTRNEEKLKATKEAAERLESDLALARELQMEMLRTDFPPNLFAMLKPAKEVGGDLYDFDLKGDRLFFAIGDVSGKGLPASLVMAITSATLHLVAESELPLDMMLRHINDSFSARSRSGMFVTLFIARLDLSTGHMDYCNAGHNPLLVIPDDGEPYFLKCKPNIAIGMLNDFAYEAESIDFKRGTRIVAYTDGVTEAERKDLSQFGNNCLLAWAKQMPTTSDKATLEERSIVENLCGAVTSFAEGHPQNDDITIMSIRV